MASQQRYDRRDIRRLNAVSVLNRLHMHGSMSRANIAGELGLTRATVSNIVAELIAASLVTETEYTEGGTGRPGLLLELNPKCGCMVSVEIDLDRISLLLSDFGQGVISRKEVLSSVEDPVDETLGKAVKLVEEAIEVGRGRGLACLGICVALAGLVNHEQGQLVFGPTSGWDHVPLKADWETQFGVPVYVENEAHASAIGAHHFGATQGVKNLIYLSLGVGLAAGVFVDGALLRGKHGYAGQVGHTRFMDNGVTCGCGKQGCWVTEVGASGILRKLSAESVDVPREVGSGVDWVELVHAQAMSGDKRVLAVLDGVGRQIGQGLARLTQTFNPSTIIVGGRLGKLMQSAEPAIREALLERTLPYMAESIVLIVSGTGEDPQMGGLATVFGAVMQNPSCVEDN